MDWATVTVIELASVLAGPSVGQWLAELGARVIKVENPLSQGDVTRSWKLTSEGASEQKGAYFSAVNWGKESIGLNLKRRESQPIMEALLTKADIVLASFLPGQGSSMGLDYETIKQKHPKIIWAEINGYGPDDPRPAYDAIIQAEAGFTYMNGQGEQISKMPVALMDVMAAHHLKQAILLAMLERQTTGRGKRVQVSLIHAGVSSLVNQATNWLVANHLPQPVGSEHPNIVPYGTIFITQDHKQLVLAVGTDAQFGRLCSILGEEVPPEFQRNQQRVRQRQQVNSWLSGLIRRQAREDLLDLLRAQRIPAGAVRNMQEVFEAPEAAEVMIHGQDKSGLRQMISNGIKSRQVLTSPPAFHEQAVSLLTELGFSAEQISHFVNQGIIPPIE